MALTLQELLGTWEENAARFRPGQSVPGVVCGKTDYGVFIALTPNLCGLAERDDTLEPGQPVCVYIKAIHPETLKLKLTVLHRLDALPPQPLPFTKTQGRLDVWRYGSREHAKKRDGVLTFGCGKSVSIFLFQRRTDAHRPLQAHTNSPQSFA